ncbi:uncharacterized protein DEA37_0010943 [Paragonimus westermani]|uniref:Uncharacterized protein n=1 Tax=Paragonimus westermani TaxID=34504 RepID=A0A5J4NBH2_9TREM|nr:uncharacterized protein DEA37_0010943 [Paragonimus westermani]
MVTHFPLDEVLKRIVCAANQNLLAVPIYGVELVSYSHNVNCERYECLLFCVFCTFPHSSALVNNVVACPPPPPSCEPVEPPPNDSWLSLVRLQSFVGSWDMDAQLASALGIPLDLLKTSQPKTWPSPADTAKLQSSVWATAMVISYFEHRLADQKDEWELLAQKAHSWLLAQACSVQPCSTVARQLCDRLLELAKQAIESSVV